ncbi:APC family permease [Pseudonocardiaceae bacterium YIM PH 21723]|nr:APC family permease [Pseudonocardiaceae bacterium YIM PH 21723]
MSEKPALRRELSLLDLIVYGLLFIGPLAPVGIFGVLDQRSGGAVAQVYLVATLAMALTAVSYAVMSRVVPEAGSVFSYAKAGLGSTAGFFGGWLVLLDYLLIPSVAYLFTGIATNALFPEIPIWVVTGFAVLVTTAINLTGVRPAAIVGLVVLVFEVVLLLVFVVAAVVVLVQHGPERPWFSPMEGDLSPVLSAVSVAVLSFLGFDAIASFAEESTGPSKQIGRAMLFCLALAGVLFFAQTYLAALLTPPHPTGPAGRAFYDMLRSSIGPWLAITFTMVKAIGPAFSAMVAQAAVGRLLYGMARGGSLPTVLGSVHGRSGVPRIAIGLSTVVTLVVAVWASTRDDGLDILVSIVDVGALGAFILLHASVVGYFVIQRGSKNTWTHLIVPLLGTSVMAAILASATPLALEIGAVWLVVGLLVTWRTHAGHKSP